MNDDEYSATMEAEDFLPRGYQRNKPRHYDSPQDKAHEYWSRQRLSAATTYQHGVYALATQLIPIDRASRVTDLGCGPGTKLPEIAGRRPLAQITGIDRRSAVTFCRERHGFGKWIEIDLHSASAFPSVPADVVICADVIEHLESPLKFLRAVKTALSPTGRLVISTPDRVALWGQGCLSSPNPEHVCEWSLPEFKKLLVAAGFAVESSVRQIPVRLWPPTPLAMDYMLSRLKRRMPLRTTQVHVVRMEDGDRLEIPRTSA